MKCQEYYKFVIYILPISPILEGKKKENKWLLYNGIKCRQFHSFSFYLYIILIIVI